MSGYCFYRKRKAPNREPGQRHFSAIKYDHTSRLHNGTEIVFLCKIEKHDFGVWLTRIHGDEGEGVVSRSPISAGRHRADKGSGDLWTFAMLMMMLMTVFLWQARTVVEERRR